MNQDMKQLLDDLYAIDPSLHAKETELIPLLAQLLRAKPNAEVDANFAFTLRKKLMSAPNSVQAKPFLARVPLIAALSVLGLVIAVPAAYFLTTDSRQLTTASIAYTALSDRAFGALSAQDSTGVRSGGGDTVSMEREENGTAFTSAAGGFGGGGVTSEAKMIAPSEPYYGTVYSYAFDGTLTLPGGEGTVYRISNGISLPNLGNTDLGVINLSRFGNLETQYLTLRQDDANGYTVSIDTVYGTISINPNDGFWARYTDGAGTMKADTIPSEASIISTATSFLDSFGVDRSNYGEARIDNATMSRILAAAERGDSYLEEYVTVSWPMLIDGKEVLNTDGSARGISASVNIRIGKVTWANIIAPNSLEGSSYMLETDASRIEAIAERGGLYAWQPSEAQKTVEIGLGEPELVYTVHGHYDESTSRYTELFVPALRFALTDIPEGETVYQSAIVIPIAEEILDTASQEPTYRILETEGGAASDTPATDASTSAAKIEIIEE